MLFTGMQFDEYSIRPLSEQDAADFFQLVENNRSRLDFFSGTVSRTKTFEETKIFISEIIARAKDRTYFPFVIVDTKNQKIAGFLDLKNIDWNIPKTELGCYIDQDYQNKGITTKAFSCFCEFCFSEYKFEKLFLRTHESNISARRVAEKCGFQIEGTIRKDYKTSSGELVDLIYYGRVKDG